MFNGVERTYAVSPLLFCVKRICGRVCDTVGVYRFGDNISAIVFLFRCIADMHPRLERRCNTMPIEYIHMRLARVRSPIRRDDRFLNVNRSRLAIDIDAPRGKIDTRQKSLHSVFLSNSPIEFERVIDAYRLLLLIFS